MTIKLTALTLKLLSITLAPIQGVGEPFQDFDRATEFPESTLELFFNSLLGALTTIGGIAFFLYFIFGAYNWITSHGEPEKVAKAQRYITNALIGLILIVGTWAIVGIIGLVLGFNILNLRANLLDVINVTL